MTSPPAPPPLRGVRVAELGGGFRAPYAGRLLCDLGAEVVKVEPPGGDPVRHIGAATPGHPEWGGPMSGLFVYLNAGKRSVVLDLESAADRERARRLLADADIILEDLGPGRLEELDLVPTGPRSEGQALIRVSDFGQTGPYVGRPITPLTMQAASGWITIRGTTGKPVAVGGQLPDYVTGVVVAAAALTARRAAGISGRVETADVSMMESLILATPFPMLRRIALLEAGYPDMVFTPFIPGVLRCRDGWIGVNCLTGQHWKDMCVVFGVPEFSDSYLDLRYDGSGLDAFYAAIQPWLDNIDYTTAIELFQEFRVPAAPIATGATVADLPQFAARGSFRRRSDGLVMPRSPFRFSRTPVAQPEAAPALGTHTDDSGWRTTQPRPAPARREADPALPLAGLRILDLGTFWAGPSMTCYLGAFGADIIKVESVRRPDGFRYLGAFPAQGDDWYERSGLFQATNLNKRDITLDLTTEQGHDLFVRLLQHADIVVENFSARVMDQFGLDYETLKALRPDVIMVRLPGFGLEGPWRDHVGFGNSLEQVAGLAWTTGFPDGGPETPGGYLDPIVGIHAVVAVLAAVEHRERTGEGQLIELAQLEVGSAVNPSPPITYSLTGQVEGRTGNRSDRYAPQGVYTCADENGWVALSVRDDRDWQALCRVIDGSAGPDAGSLAGDPRLATHAGRLAHHDEIDQRISAWATQRSSTEAEAALRQAGLPAARVLVAASMYDEVNLVERGFYQSFVHPVTGERAYPGWPVRFSFAPSHHRFVSPTLGQHNEEILGGELGLSAEDLAELRAKGVIGEQPAGV